ncbi:MAG: ABC transporter substrate-binding protein [Candidatus Bathyarchaeia archaeon]|jgi:peptide/nickel transport system substrate-binding protein
MRIAFLALFLSVLVLVPVNAQAPTTPYGGTLKVGWVTEGDTLNPFVTVLDESIYVLSLTYDTLGKYDQNMNIVPWLASSWDVSPDGSTWTFHLVKNATWSDGVPLTAADVKFTYDFAIANNIGSAASYVESVQSVNTPDNYTVVITRKSPLSAGFDGTLAYSGFPVLPKHIWEKITPDQILKFDNVPCVGSGPFLFDQWKRGEFLSLKANPNYWHGRPYLDEIVFTLFKDYDTMLAALKTGEIDVVAREVPALSASSLTSDPNIKVTTSPDFWTRIFTPNDNINGTGNVALRDARVRRAMSYAIDRDLLAQTVQLGLADPAVSFLPPAYGIWHNPNVQPYPFNLTTAAQILEAAGYTDPQHTGVRSNSKGVRLEFNYWVLNRWPEEMRAASQIQQWFAQIGIKLNVQAMDGDTIIAYNYPVWRYDIYLWGWSIGPDWDRRLWVLTTDSVRAQWSASGWSNSTYDQLYQKQRYTLDPDQRKAIVWQMQDLIQQESPEIPIYNMRNIAAYRIDKFTGFISMTEGVLSEINIWSWLSVRLITPPQVTMTTGTTTAASAPDNTPWIVAAVAIIIAIAAIGYTAMRRRTATKD